MKEAPPAWLMEKHDTLHAIETREGQLWLLAFFLIFLLAVSLFVIDFAFPWTSGPNYLQPIGDALGNNMVRATLLVVVVLILAYFREKVRALQGANQELMYSLVSNQSHLLSKSRQLTRWQELSHALISTNDLQRLLELVVETALEVTGGESGLLMLLDATGEELEVVAARGQNAEARRSLRLKAGEGIAGYVTQTGKPLLLRTGEVSKDHEALLAQRAEIGSEVCAPLVIGGQPAGALCVDRRPSAGDFTQQEVDTLSAFANQAALAIDKAHLYASHEEQVVRSQHIMETLEDTQAQLLQSEKLASIGLLAGGVAREIDSPLTVILGRTELLMEALAESPYHKDLAVIREQTKRISEIVWNLLRFSRENRQHTFEPTDVNTALEQTLALVGKTLEVNRVQLARELGSELPRVMGNRAQLQQAFTNIVLNASEAMPAGGMLTVKSWVDGDAIKISFADTGVGIPTDNLQCIFDPFFTSAAKEQGTGLGLAIAHGIVHSHGGDIRVQSELGKGSVFTIELPTAVG